jgi:nucleoid DNA-binding protein
MCKEMREFVNVITELLSKHPCVIIPGFGGFIVNEKTASVDCRTGHFYPPQKEIIFNPHLSHNDGLLAHALMKRQNISFEEADKKIGENVQAIKSGLSVYRKYDLDGLGCFTMEKGYVAFSSGKTELINENALGLKEFYFPALLHEKGNSLSVAGKYEKSPVSKMLIGGAAATLALFLFCQPIKNEGSSGQASLLPVKSLSENLLAKERVGKEAGKDVSYYIVAAEFNTEKEALEYIGEIKMNDTDKLSILSVGNLYYVTVSDGNVSETDKKDSFSQLNELGLRYPEFSQMYILGLR